MSFDLPLVPKDLTAAATANKINNTNREMALKLLNECLEKLKIQVFPCIVYTACDSTIATQVVKRLNEAGYKAEFKKQDCDYDDRFGYTPNNYIQIDNPLLST